MKPGKTVLAFHVLSGEPVAVEVKPVMVETSARPDFVELTRVGIGHKVFAFMLVGPGGETLESIGIKRWIEQDDSIVQ